MPKSPIHSFARVGALLCALPLLLSAGEPKPVPRMQAVPQPESQISFQRDGVEITRLYFGSELRRPFLFPVVGPSGRSLTRMGHPHDPETHSHHNSVWISHQNVGGVNFWEDRSPIRIAQQRVLRFEDSDAEAFVETENAWLDKDGKETIHELRRTAVRPRDQGEWLLELDLEFQAREKPVTFGQTAFGVIGVRMVKTIGVADGGGTIRNSEGDLDEEGCFRKPARWCDYSGPIATGKIEGITLLDHPANANSPVPFHVRNDGWMGAAVSFPGPIEVKPGEPLRLRYALYIHSGPASPPQIENEWASFAKSEWRQFAVKKPK